MYHEKSNKGILQQRISTLCFDAMTVWHHHNSAVWRLPWQLNFFSMTMQKCTARILTERELMEPKAMSMWFNGAETNGRIAHNLGILLMNSNWFAIVCQQHYSYVCSDIYWVLASLYVNQRKEQTISFVCCGSWDCVRSSPGGFWGLIYLVMNTFFPFRSVASSCKQYKQYTVKMCNVSKN